jgi:hypothetical protein
MRLSLDLIMHKNDPAVGIRDNDEEGECADPLWFFIVNRTPGSNAAIYQCCYLPWLSNRRSNHSTSVF